MWGISWVPWGVFSTVGDIMSTVGVILSTVGDVQYHGGISWCTWGISWVPWRVFSTVGEKSFVIWVPHGTEHPPRYSWYPPHASWYPPTVLKFQRMVSPTVLNTLHGTHDIPPRASWYPPWYWTSPTVLKITPHSTHESPHGTEHPPRYSRYPPHLSWYPPTVLNTPHGTQDIPPRYSWYPPTVLMISPHGTEHPHSTEHPPRYCTHIIQGEDHSVTIHLPLANNWCTPISITTF